MMRGDRGQVLMLVGLVLLVLVGFAVLGVDVAYMYLVRQELQRCADSGALAGAAIFDNNATPDLVRAETLARDYASAPMNVVATAPLDRFGDIEVEFPPGNRIRVVTHRTVNLFFASIVGLGTKYIDATATAGVLPPGSPSNPTPNYVVRLVE